MRTFNNVLGKQLAHQSTLAWLPFAPQLLDEASGVSRSARLHSVIPIMS